MYKVNLQDYKGSKIYFQLFDVLLKDIPIKKEDYLIEHDINPSSYRLARKIEQNVGKTIIEKLASIYNYKVPTEKEIDEIEYNFNLIYEDMYYKIYNNYDKYIKYIDELEEKNYIIFPIINLFKIFLNCNNNLGYEKQIIDNENLFNNLSKYKIFLNNSLIEIYTIFEIVYQKVDVSFYLLKHYDNALVYFMLASKSLGELKYAECIYFINICKEILIKENNYRRLINLYYKYMQCLLYFRDYEECYNLSKQVLLMCKSFNVTGYEFNTAQKSLAVSYIALEKYEDVVKLYDNKESLNYNEFCFYLVALYESDKTRYAEAINEYTKAANELNDEFYKLILVVIDEYNTKGNKKRLDELNKYLMLTFIKMLKERK